ncbi:hypothetical protein, partial [Actinokineospora sp.]|uniref:hypothetical protein n=1 Tax=Actinokineospora sp. TaxID=1872133 RepID=UPI003D6A6581
RRRRVLGVAGPVRPRRSRCRSCRITHVLLPAVLLLRLGHGAATVWAVLMARAGGTGYRPTASSAGVSISTVRRWWRRFTGRADEVRRWFWRLAVAVGIDPEIPDASGSAPADAVAAITAAAAGRGQRFGGSVVGMAAQVHMASVGSGGRLLAPAWPGG